MITDSSRERERQRIELRLAELEIERRALESARQALDGAPINGDPSRSSVTQQTNSHEKVLLFRSLFRGRTDVYPARWENKSSGKSGYAPACANEWVRGVCEKPRIKCGDCTNQAFIAVSDRVVERHLRGDIVAGIYPLMPGNTCYFVAVDFDGEGWIEDSRAFRHACSEHHVPVAIERSRSGAGAHAWIFFAEALMASQARQLATGLMSAALERRPDIGFRSYDRLFPSQDLMPDGGFGNLIALPLQRVARDRGHSVFIDDELNPFLDQWEYLASLKKIEVSVAERLLAMLSSRRHGITGIPLPISDETSPTPWALPQTSNPELHVTEPLPKRVPVTLADQIYIDRTALPTTMVTRLMRLAAFQNPEFYQAQALRLPTFDKPRVISRAELHAHHIALPRGCMDELREVFTTHGVQIDLTDERCRGDPLVAKFMGTLQPEQQRAAEALLAHDHGVLAATTAFGKTARNLTHRCPRLQRPDPGTSSTALDQWVEQLRAFLDVEPDAIGTMGGGKKRLTGKIDVAMIQSLMRHHDVDERVMNYGHLIVDECHHGSAVSFEAVIKRARGRYVLGLSATVARKDGHQPIVFMQCGPVRHRVTARAQLAARGGVHRAEMCETGFTASELMGSRVPIAAVYKALAESEPRNARIFDDVLTALEMRRRPLVLTERRDHLELMASRFAPFVKKVIVLRGGMPTRERDAALTALRSEDPGERLVLATGRYLGEGFDYAPLDTLFLTLPISWKGTLAQYVGRLHREHADKRDVLVVDYSDLGVPMIARMAVKRVAGYRNLGYVVEHIGVGNRREHAPATSVIPTMD